MYIITTSADLKKRVMKYLYGDKVVFINTGPVTTCFELNDICVVTDKDDWEDSTNTLIEGTSAPHFGVVQGCDKTQIALAEFPSHGWCIKPEVELVRYLKATRETAGNDEVGASGIAWNGDSYWSIQTGSTKRLYTMDALYHSLSAVPDDAYEEECEPDHTVEAEESYPEFFEYTKIKIKPEFLGVFSSIFHGYSAVGFVKTDSPPGCNNVSACFLDYKGDPRELFLLKAQITKTTEHNTFSPRWYEEENRRSVRFRKKSLSHVNYDGKILNVGDTVIDVRAGQAQAELLTVIRVFEWNIECTDNSGVSIVLPYGVLHLIKRAEDEVGDPIDASDKTFLSDSGTVVGSTVDFRAKGDVVINIHTPTPKVSKRIDRIKSFAVPLKTVKRRVKTNK